MSADHQSSSTDTDVERRTTTPTKLIFESELWTERPKGK